MSRFTQSLETLIWVDGNRASSLPLPDRGVSYGDGLFETILLRQGEPLFLDRHIARLREGLRCLRFPIVDALARTYIGAVRDELRTKNWRWAALRLTVTRGAGQRGYAPPSPAQPRIVLEVTQLDRDCDVLAPPAVLGLSAIRLGNQPVLAGIKHLNRLEQVMAANDAAAAALDEMIMLDSNDRVISVISGNVFIYVDRILVTPEISSTGIRGTRRSLIIDRWSARSGIPVEVRQVTVEQLEYAEEVFYSNALVGLRPVQAIDRFCWNSHRVCESLFEIYRSDLDQVAPL